MIPTPCVSPKTTSVNNMKKYIPLMRGPFFHAPDTLCVTRNHISELPEKLNYAQEGSIFHAPDTLCLTRKRERGFRIQRPHPKCIHALNFYKLYPLPIRRLYAAYGKIYLITFGKFRLATLWKSSPGHFWKISQLMLANHTRKAHLQNISSVLRFFLRVR